jgi:tetratricopeptide (TPR) repeat protein
MPERTLMTLLPDLFARAVGHHQAGDLGRAEALCRQILEHDPAHADALNLLGMLAHQARRAEAVEILRRAVAARPGDGTIHYNLGVAYQVLGRLPDAVACYREALRLQPAHADAHHNLGDALLTQGDHAAAQASLEQAVRLRADFAEAHNKLGIAYREQQKKDEAVAAFRRAAELKPDCAAFHSNLANLLTSQGQAEEAFHHYRHAVRLEPAEPAHHSNQGNVLILLGRPDEAEICCREALRLNPDLANAHHNLAIARSLHGALDEAIDLNAQALRFDPRHAGAHNCQALWALQKGNFEEGWREYRWRWDIPGAAPRDFAQPAWDGSELAGRTVLLHAEQGLGDTVQFVRYTALVKRRGGTVIVECQPALVPLLRGCAGIDRLVPRGSPLPPFDVHAPLLDLPRIFRTTLASVPAQVPYLFPDLGLIETWRRELAGSVSPSPPYSGERGWGEGELTGQALKVGIAWQGNPKFPGDRLRSVPLRHFAPLGRREGVRLFALQKGSGRDQVGAALADFHVTDLGGRLDESSGAFMDTAAVMMSLDLVVTTDTAVAHLAGALGVPVWVALGVGADWRYLEGREDSPWYPTMRLFRQERLYEWDELFERIAAALPVRAPTPAPAAVARAWGQALGHYGAGRLAEAEQGCRQVLDAEPCHAEAVHLLGVLASQAGKHDLAAERLGLATRLGPDNAGYHYNLGVARQVLGRVDEAVASYREAMRLEPGHADAHHNLGFALAQQGSLQDAETHYRAAVRLKPDHSEAHHNLALLLRQEGRLTEAVAHFREAVRVHPEHVHALHNLGLTLVGLGQVEEGLPCYERVLALRPDEAETRFCRSMVWLLRGEFERGWVEYEWRWRSKQAPPLRHNQPAWDGSELAGRTVLLYAEQGLGDTLQFIRYATLVKRRGGTVVVECQPALVPLLRACPAIDRIVAPEEALPPIDVQAPLLSLPRIFGTTRDTIPAAVPYVFADPALVERWRRDLGGLRAFKVGIAWQGSPTHLWDRQRSIPLEQFAALAQVPGVRLISLQHGQGREQAQAVADRFAVLDCCDQDDSSGWEFGETAAIVKNLNLVITCDTSVAHLAGSLGAPVWVALAHAPDWRWQLGRDDSPWYPTMRLFRQTRPGDWNGVFLRMARALRERFGLAASAGPVRPAPLATVCILTYGDYLPYFERCLESVLATAPHGAIELRLGFNDAPASLDYARERLGLEGGAAPDDVAVGGVRRTEFVTPGGMTVRLWHSTANLYKEPMARLMYHDVPLVSEYAVWLDDDSYVETGWWEALLPLLARKVDYIGQRWWVDYLPGQWDMIRAQPWYRGVPFDHRAGRPGTWFMTGGFVVTRAERLREANFPDDSFCWKGDRLQQFGGDKLLGEIARQLGWTWSVHDAHVKVNVDLQGNHPAPRRGGTSRQLSADVDVVIH